MTVMMNLANTIHPNIVMTGDSPNQHESKRVPMLDLEIFVEIQDHKVKIGDKLETVKVDQVCYTFYKN